MEKHHTRWPNACGQTGPMAIADIRRVWVIPIMSIGKRITYSVQGPQEVMRINYVARCQCGVVQSQWPRTAFHERHEAELKFKYGQSWTKKTHDPYCCPLHHVKLLLMRFRGRGLFFLWPHSSMTCAEPTLFHQKSRMGCPVSNARF